jgi:hypothetical protein
VKPSSAAVPPQKATRVPPPDTIDCALAHQLNGDGNHGDHATDRGDDQA